MPIDILGNDQVHHGNTSTYILLGHLKESYFFITVDTHSKMT